MTYSRKLVSAAALAIALGGASLAGAAHADVACNRWGECWRVHDHYTNYPANLGVVFHDEAWRAAHAGRHWRWRADRDDDHGYYAHGHWRHF